MNADADFVTCVCGAWRSVGAWWRGGWKGFKIDALVGAKIGGVACCDTFMKHASMIARGLAALFAHSLAFSSITCT